MCGAEEEHTVPFSALFLLPPEYANKMKTTAPDPLLLELTKSLRFTKKFDPVMESTDLDAIEKLVLAEVLHYRVSGRPFYMSMGKLCIRAGTKRSTLKKRMRDMESRGYIHVTVSRRNFNQANVVEVGPATYSLLQGTEGTRSRDEDGMDSFDEVLLRPPALATKPKHPTAEPKHSASGQALQQKRKRPTWPVNKMVSKFDELLPAELFRTLTYNPSKGKELTETDAVKVFAWHGLSNERAWEWWDARTKAGWPPMFTRWELCRKAAAKLADEQDRSMEPPAAFQVKEPLEVEPPPFDDDPTDWEAPPLDDDPFDHIDV